jgi:hypothetical protein
VDEAPAEEVDEVGRRTVLDQDDTDDVAVLDLSPGSDTEAGPASMRRKMLEFARRAEAIPLEADNKLQGAIREVKDLLKDGFRPVVFCRFVDTADYVARHMREALAPRVRIEPVTGLLPPAEREARIETLVAESGKYVLVCTDCLAEGVNLQEHFDAVLHYDLAWNPTRHEQREGRVDRFGQKKAEVRVVTYYGADNPIDGVILDVLIRKHKRIKSDLGVTVAVPGSSEQIAETLFEGALFREKTGAHPEQLKLAFIDEMELKKKALHAEWENARDREKASRSRFAQQTLSPQVVAQELQSVRAAIGSSEDVARFFHEVLHAAGVPAETKGKAITVHISQGTPRAFRQAIGLDESFTGRFDLPLEEGEIYLGRTSSMIEGLAGWTLDQALDPEARDVKTVTARCGVISTSMVETRKTLLVVRFRYHLQSAGAASEAILCEEVVSLACTGQADAPNWLTPEEAEHLLEARPERNLIPTAVDQQIGLLMEALPKLQASLASVATERASGQLAAHERVRESLRAKGRVRIQPVLPVDILGAYVLVPIPRAGGAS